MNEAMDVLRKLVADREYTGEIPPRLLPDLFGEIEIVRAKLFRLMLSGQQSAEITESVKHAERAYKPTEVATRLSLKTAYVYELIRRGELPAVKIRKYYRIRESDIERFLDEHTEGGMDKRLYVPYSHRKGVESEWRRASTDSDTAGSDTGGIGGKSRRQRQHRGKVGTKRTEHPRANSPIDSVAGSGGSTDEGSSEA